MKFHFILCCCLCLMVALCACERNDLQKVDALTDDSLVPLETARRVALTYFDSAQIKVKLQAPMMEHYITGEPYWEFKQGVRVVFLGKDTTANTRLFAKYGIRYEKSNTMVARDSVVVINPKGEKLQTEELTWDETAKKIRTDQHVTIYTEDEIIYGTGLEANQDFTQYTIGKIKGQVNIETPK